MIEKPPQWASFAPELDSPLTLRLYVSGQALNSRAAIRNLEPLREALVETAVDGMSISLSIGIAPVDGSLDSEEALQEADRALYEAKRQGRNRVVLRRPGDS